MTDVNRSYFCYFLTIRDYMEIHALSVFLRFVFFRTFPLHSPV